MFVAAPVATIVCVVDPCSETTIPDVVRRARERAGPGGRYATVAFRINAAAANTRIHVTRDTIARAQGTNANGEYCAYLAVHAIPDRKKNSFIAVARDPIRAVYEYNHGSPIKATGRAAAVPSTIGTESAASSECATLTRTTLQKEAHLAAPYLALASVVFPFLTREIANEAAASWMTRIRGAKSKYARGHALAHQYAATYYGNDVPIDERTLAAHLETHVGIGSSHVFAQLRRDLGRKQAQQHQQQINKENVGVRSVDSRCTKSRVFTADDLFAVDIFTDAIDHRLFTQYAQPIVFCV